MADPLVIITSTQPRADEIVADLARKNIKAFPCPALNVREIHTAYPDGDYDLMLLSSVNALRSDAPLPDLPVAAVGATTADAARKAGLQCVHTGGGTLADTVTGAPVRSAANILYPCGVYRTSGTDALLASLKADVTIWPVYETAFNPAFHDCLPQAENILMVLFSVRGAQSVAQSLQNTPLPPRMSALCLSGAVADAAADIPFKNLAVCPRPDYACLTDTIIDLVKTEGLTHGDIRNAKRH